MLILGWAELTFMTMLLRELDQGPAALPKGSEITLFNNRESPDVMGELCWQRRSLQNEPPQDKRKCEQYFGWGLVC